tara:strand:- start:503 stop:1315 length:813 start_codon:yes stop_codon:yes gene_type:complete
MINEFKSEEDAFQKNGYLIKKIDDLESLKYVSQQIFKYLGKKDSLLSKYKTHLSLRKIHKDIKKSKLNDLRVFVINELNKNQKFSECYYKIAKNVLDIIVGNEVAIQKKINLSIQVPNDTDSMLPMHSDIYAGESPFEVVVWTPLTNVEPNSMSMFITDPKNNSKINNMVTNTKTQTIFDIYKKYKNKFKFIKINYGEILIFSPILLHGNIVNKTNESRVSLNCRFKGLLSPYDVFNKTHRNIPHFFKPLTTKPITKVGFNFIKKINNEK